MSRADGYDLWLSYDPINTEYAEKYSSQIKQVMVAEGGDISDVIANELEFALNRLLGKYYSIQKGKSFTGKEGTLIAATVATIIEETGNPIPLELIPENDGYTLYSVNSSIYITSVTEKGVLYGTFAFLRLLQTGKSIENLRITSSPAVRYRMLDHWDNLDGSVERGYAGKSLWKWNDLPSRIDSRYKDYARACASIGLNATVLNNVNTQPYILHEDYLEKVAALASVFRRYGITVFLSVNFASPMILGGLDTADPCNPAVIQWWKEKVAEIYSYIPDFGGFLMKADSEGQPGPYAYGRNHADGANMLGMVLAPYGGIVIWRAFIYGFGEDDRAKKPYAEFAPLDGKFMPNTSVQVKNGACDFQPCEPVHPLFGTMDQTNLFMELQITQEYLGQENHLVYLAPMWKEVLDFDIAADGTNVGQRISRKKSIPLGEHSVDGMTGMAAVSNVGSDKNWCGSLFHPVNWYAFGRLAWDYSLSAEEIAREWAVCTWGNNEKLLDGIMYILMNSWKACVDYMTPLGLHHIMKYDHHYGPDPACDEGDREDWKPRYYHRADAKGLGFDRTSTGSNGVGQYRKPIADVFGNIAACPEKYLLWFHHVDWNYVLASGRTLKDELVYRYNLGVEEADRLKDAWIAVKGILPVARYEAVLKKLEIQCRDAREWRDVCVQYFLSFAEDR